MHLSHIQSRAEFKFSAAEIGTLSGTDSYTLATVVVDGSGSMVPFWREVLTALKEIVRGQADGVPIVATAQAAANRILADSLTAQLLQYQAVKAWSGILPQVTGGNGIPFLNIPLGNADEGKKKENQERPEQ